MLFRLVVENKGKACLPVQLIVTGYRVEPSPDFLFSRPLHGDKEKRRSARLERPIVHAVMLFVLLAGFVDQFGVVGIEELHGQQAIGSVGTNEPAIFDPRLLAHAF